MPKGNPNPSPTTRFSADNPGRAKQKGARDRFSAAFLTDLADTWQQLGKQALIACAIFDTPTFCKLGVGLMPKQLEIEDNRPEADLSDEELEMLYQDALSRLRAAKADDESSTPIAPGSQRVN
jgi:hypothetical protein